MTHEPGEVQRARQIARTKLNAVFAGRVFDREIEMLLAIGEACPFTSQWERNIWSAEADRVAAELGWYKGASIQ